MQSLQRGFSFLKQSWQMAFADHDLIKPSLLALLVGVIVTLVGSVPVILAFLVFGDSGPGRIVGYVFAAVLIFVQYTVTYVFSAMTIHLIFGYLSEGDGRMDRAWTIVRRDFLDILSLAAASTAVSLLKSLVRGKGNRGGRNFLAGLIDTIWTEATYLVLPAMVIEDIGLKEGLQRATKIVRENLLLVGVSTVGVRAVTGIIGFLLGATGIGIGLGVSLGLISLTNGDVLGVATGVGLGVLIASAFILVAVVIGSYTATAYHACLYIWARDVEKAQLSGNSLQAILPPAPLAAVLPAQMQWRPASGEAYR
jgi:hypothetical protein